jgi:hypothetical protein
MEKLVLVRSAVLKATAALTVAATMVLADGSGSGSACPSGTTLCSDNTQINGVIVTQSKCCANGCEAIGELDTKTGEIHFYIKCK